VISGESERCLSIKGLNRSDKVWKERKAFIGGDEFQKLIVFQAKPSHDAKPRAWRASPLQPIRTKAGNSLHGYKKQNLSQFCFIRR
jgi:hypothetical protein